MYLSCELPDWNTDFDSVLSSVSGEFAAGSPPVVLTWAHVAVLPTAHGGPQNNALTRLDRHRLRIDSVDLGPVDCDRDDARDRLIDELTDRLRRVQSLGARRVSVTAGPATNRNFSDVLAVLHALAPPADRLGLRLCIRNRFDSSIEQLDDLHVLFRDARAPKLRLDLDVGDFHRAAVNPCDAILSFSGRIGQVRLADLRGRTRVPLGEGNLNVPAIVEALVEERFTGPVVLSIGSGPGAVERFAADQRYLANLGVRE